MTRQPTTYPPTLVFHCVHGFLEAVQTRGIHEIGCATLQRTTPYAQGMLERRVSFIQLTARDHARDAILACSVYLKHGDFVGPDQRFTPPMNGVASWSAASASGAPAPPGSNASRTSGSSTPPLRSIPISPYASRRFRLAIPRMPRTGPNAIPGTQARAAGFTASLHMPLVCLWGSPSVCLRIQEA